MPDIGLDVRLDLDLRNTDEIFEAVDRLMADPRRLEPGHVAARLRLRHQRLPIGLGQDTALCNAEIRHLRRSRLLYLRVRKPFALSEAQQVRDVFVLLAAYPFSLHDHALLEFLRNNLLRHNFLRELRRCPRSATVQAMLQDFLARADPEHDFPT